MTFHEVELQSVARPEKGAIVSGPFGSSISAKFFVEEGVPIIRGNNLTIGGPKFVDSGFAYLTEAKASEFPNCVAVKDDIIFTAAGSIGQVGIIPADTKHSYYIISNKQMRVRLDVRKVNPEFVYYWLSSPKMTRYIIGLNNGGAVPLLNLGIIRKLPIPLPALDMQALVAGRIGAYDDLIENNKKRIALLEESARLLYREWFVHLRFPGHEHVMVTNGVPAGWLPRALEEVVFSVKDTVNPSEFEEKEIHIGLEHIPRRSFTLSEWEPAEDLASGKIRFLEGDIIFAKIRPYFHKVGFALRPGLASSDALVWRVRNDKDWPLVLCTTSSDHFVAVASKTVREGSKMPRADWNVLRKYSIPQPSEGILTAFNDAIRPIAQQCKTLALQNGTLGQARDILLPRLMSGEIAA